MSVTLRIKAWLAAAGCGLLLALAGCAPPVEPMTVLAGSELKDLQPLQEPIRTCSGVDLQFKYTGTLDGAEALATGADYDIAWFSHGKYMSLLPATRARIVTQDKIMLSPVVLGVKESRARAWGWTGNRELTWREIAAKAASGELRYAMTNPASSNSGFTALVGVAAALSGNADTFDAAGIDKAALTGFFKGQVLTAGSSGWLAEAYVREQGRLDGMVNYESVLMQLNASGELREPLVLVYPREGIITADYPIMLLNKDQREPFDRLVECLRSPELQTALMRDTQRRPVIPQVRPDNRFPAQLLVELPFPATLEQVDQLLFAYLDEHRKPSHTYFVLDVSGSMRGERIEDLRRALAGLTGLDRSITGQFARFRAREQVTLIPFNQGIVYVWDRAVSDTSPEGPDMQALREQITRLEANGGTGIYDALARAYGLAQQAQAQQADAFYSIVLLSDGENTSGSDINGFERFYRGLPEDARAVHTFPILFGASNPQEMEYLAELTGGRVFDAHAHALNRVFKDIRGYQ